MIEQDEKRVVCEGCRTGNYFLCNSFPGKALQHAQREIDYTKAKKKRKQMAQEEDDMPRSNKVYRRDGVE